MAELDKNPKKPAIVTCHHYLTPPTTKFEPELRESHALFRGLESRQQAKAYIFGHQHDWKLHGTSPFYRICLPALGWNFRKDAVRGWVECHPIKEGMTLKVVELEKNPQFKGPRELKLKWRH